jgi:hypothetical protein
LGFSDHMTFPNFRIRSTSKSSLMQFTHPYAWAGTGKFKVASVLSVLDLLITVRTLFCEVSYCHHGLLLKFGKKKIRHIFSRGYVCHKGRSGFKRGILNDKACSFPSFCFLENISTLLSAQEC